MTLPLRERLVPAGLVVAVVFVMVSAPKGLGPWTGPSLVPPGGEGPGPRIGEPRRNSLTQAYSKSACFKVFS
jgi:hypothetical protein